MSVRSHSFFHPFATGVILSGIALVVLLTFFVPSVFAQTPHADLETVEQHIVRTLKRDRVPGAAVAIVQGTDVIYLQGFGEDGFGEPVDKDTHFVIGSMSKAFTGMVAMRLIKAGSLTSDTSVAQNVPELEKADKLAWEGVTLHHLLTHVSGVPVRTPEMPAGATLAQHTAAIAEVELAHPPGTRHEYSSGNYLLAARMLETISGMSFERLMAEQVLVPLGFRQSDATGTASDVNCRSTGYQYWAIWPKPVELAAEPGRLATAALTASAADMANFLRFQLGDGTWHGQRLLSAAGLTKMHQGTAQGDGFRYGLGWRNVDLAGTPTVQHGGVLPNFRGKMILLPEYDAAVVVLTNASSVLPLPIRPTSHELANDIAMHLAGGPLGLPNLGYRPWLTILWIGLGLVLAHQIFSLARILLRRDPARHPLWSAAADVVMVIAILTMLPRAIGLSLKSIAAQTPDLALWLVAMSVLALCAAIIRIFRACRLRGTHT